MKTWFTPYGCNVKQTLAASKKEVKCNNDLKCHMNQNYNNVIPYDTSLRFILALESTKHFLYKLNSNCHPILAYSDERNIAVICGAYFLTPRKQSLRHRRGF